MRKHPGSTKSDLPIEGAVLLAGMVALGTVKVVRMVVNICYDAYQERVNLRQAHDPPVPEFVDDLDEAWAARKLDVYQDSLRHLAEH